MLRVCPVSAPDRAVACVAYVQGRIAAGLAAPSAFHGDLSTAHRNTGGEAVSRAYYKLREVRARCACVPADLSVVAAAIDVGAAPGGWTACLAKAGVGRVVAVDPGELRLPDTPPYNRAVEHLPPKRGPGLIKPDPAFTPTPTPPTQTSPCT